jgi:acyl-CoA reductase-like NAD-dependent aldehyde dehydrogenase
MENEEHADGRSSHYTVPLQINGAEIITPTTFDVIDPATEAIAWKSSSASVEDAIRAAEAAQAAFPAWAKKKPSARREIILKAADIIVRRLDELVGYCQREIAANDDFGRAILGMAVDTLRQVASLTVTDAGHVPVCEEEGRSALVMKEPYGVVLGIAPW